MEMKEAQRILAAPLRADEVEFRIKTIAKSGWAMLLAYKNSRVDMNRLDDALGLGFWGCEYHSIDGLLYCTVRLWNSELKQWAEVQDVGTKSNTESEKGQASDAFKRACVKLGIGRCLYGYPNLFVKLHPDEFEVDGHKAKATRKLKINEWDKAIDIKDDEVVGIQLSCGGEQRFGWGTLR